MPIYEFLCRSCSRRFSVLTLRASERVRPLCKYCGSRRVERLLSRFAMPRSEERRMESLADPSAMGDIDENDPRSIARWMRRVGGELGDEIGREELDEMVDEIERGSETGDSDGAGGTDDL